MKFIGDYGYADHLRADAGSVGKLTVVSLVNREKSELNIPRGQTTGTFTRYKS